MKYGLIFYKENQIFCKTLFLLLTCGTIFTINKAYRDYKVKQYKYEMQNIEFNIK